MDEQNVIALFDKFMSLGPFVVLAAFTLWLLRKELGQLIVSGRADKESVQWFREMNSMFAKNLVIFEEVKKDTAKMREELERATDILDRIHTETIRGRR